MLSFEEEGAKLAAIPGMAATAGFVPAAAAKSAPALLVDFSACVAPIERR